MMVKFFLTTSLLVCVFTICTYSQTNVDTLAAVKIRVYNIPDSITTKLALFELSKSKFDDNIDSNYLAMSIYKLDKNKINIDGIYAFRVTGPHFTEKIFILENNRLTIFKNSYFNDFLYEYYIFLSANKIPPNIGMKYLLTITKYLNNKYNE